MLNKEQRNFLLPKAYNAAIRAGAAILDIYEQSGDYDVTLKSDKTPITIADRKAHNVIKEYLGQTRVPQLSEEGREMLYEERRRWDLFWLVDPLDGTKEFLKGNGEFTVNIALMSDNKAVLSIVYVPYIKKMYFACPEEGSFLKENVMPDSEAEFTLEEIFEGAVKLPLVKAANSPIKIAVSRSHITDDTYACVDKVKKIFPFAEIVEQGSSYKFCLLAEGTLDCYPRTSNTYEWDTAAGELILEAAGGSTRSIPDKKPLEYNKESLLNPWFFCKSKFMPEM